MRDPQLKNAISDFDIISKYCPLSFCEEERLRFETLEYVAGAYKREFAAD